MVVPFAAGGPSDVASRILAQYLSESLRQQVIVENVGGAGGVTGSARVAKAAPDGYQLVMGNSGTHAYNQALYKKPSYNAATDFAPVGLAYLSSKVLVVRKDLPVNTLQEFIDYTKQNQRKMQFGSAGSGSTSHISCLLLNAALGVDVVHVPYRGAAPVMQDLIGGRLDYMCDSTSTVLPQVQDKTIKALAVLAPKRTSALPDLATADEQGLTGFDVDLWSGLFFPKGTPETIVRRLNQALNKALDSPVLQKRFEALGLVVPAPEKRSSSYLASLVPAEIDKWAGPIKASGVSMDQ